MRIRHAMLGALLGLTAGASAAPLRAEIRTFEVDLDGRYGAAPTGSAAMGSARVAVDTERRRVSVDLTVDGITPGDLWDKLVAAPIGPVHFHKYATAAGGDSVLVLPLPYGADYQPTERGMRLVKTDLDYAAGAKLVNSSLSFEDFVSALEGGRVVLNIHTDAFNPGEISGRVTHGWAPLRRPKAAAKGGDDGHDHAGHATPAH